MPGSTGERKATLSTNRYPDGRGLVDPLADGIERAGFPDALADARLAEDLAARYSDDRYFLPSSLSSQS